MCYIIMEKCLCFLVTDFTNARWLFYELHVAISLQNVMLIKLPYFNVQLICFEKCFQSELMADHIHQDCIIYIQIWLSYIEKRCLEMKLPLG